MSTNEAIELEVDDFEEPPPTDPCPGVIRASAIRIDPSDDDLEKRLAWLADEVRTTSAEQAKIRREQTVLERREYKTVPISTEVEQRQDPDLPKVTLAIGVDPKRDPTLVGRRISEHHWDFEIVDPEELSRTLPLDTQATIADPLPFQPSADKPSPQRANSARIFLGLLLVLFIGLSLQHLAHTSSDAAFAELPMARRGLAQATISAELRYDQAETVRLLTLPAPRKAIESEALVPATSTIFAPSPPSPTSTIFKYVKPHGSIQRKPAVTNTPPDTQPTTRIAPIPKDTLGF